MAIYGIICRKDTYVVWKYVKKTLLEMGLDTIRDGFYMGIWVYGYMGINFMGIWVYGYMGICVWV
jgi:hypothetical protein